MYHMVSVVKCSVYLKVAKTVFPKGPPHRKKYL